MKLKKYKSILENSISLFLLKAIDLVLTISLIPFLIVKIGLHNYGVYAFVMSSVLFFVNILNYGFNLSTVRAVAKNRKDHAYINKVFNQVFSVKIALFVLLSLLLFLLVFAIPSLRAYKLLCFFSSFLLLVDLFSVRWLFYGLEKMKYITLISFIGNLIYVSLVVLFIKVEADFLMIPVYEVIGLGVITITAFFLVLKKYKFDLELLSLAEVISYLKENFNAFVSLFLPSTYNLTIVFIVGLIGIPVQVSFIQIGVKFTAVFSTIVNILSNVFFPVSNRVSKAQNSMRSSLLIMGGLLSISMLVFSEFIVQKWLRFDSIEELETIVQIVKLLSMVPFLTSIVAGFGINGLLVLFKDKLFSKITFISICVMLLSSFILVPLYPLLGAAISFLLGKLVYAILVYFNYRKTVAIE